MSFMNSSTNIRFVYTLMPRQSDLKKKKTLVYIEFSHIWKEEFSNQNSLENPGNNRWTDVFFMKLQIQKSLY